MALFYAGLTGASEVSSRISFVDLDGDGFNDNFADDNDNAIPDRFESKTAPDSTETGSLLGDVFNIDVNLDELRTTTQKFKMRQFRTRSLVQRCRALGEEEAFGPVNDSGIGAVGGGGCAGGVCRP